MKIYNLILTALAIFYVIPSYASSINSQYPFKEDSLKTIEKVYLHTDRSKYYPGEDIWFKAYLIDASDRSLSNHSSNLHVELISPKRKIIESHVIRLNRGLGNGDIHLAEKLQSGIYRLRAYTNYMRNYGDQFFFIKDIAIINMSDAGKAFSDSIDYTGNKPEINFFPEGGSLVDNVTSVVAFKSTDGPGYATDVEGEIYSSTGEKVTEFKSAHRGMGTFSLSPVPGLKYYATTKTSNGDLVRYEIQKSLSTGVVLTVAKIHKGKLTLILKTNPETLDLIMNRDLFITVSARSIVFKSYSIKMKSLNSFFNLPTDDLPDGIIMLTLSGINNTPLCERLVFLQNAEDVSVKVKTDKTTYARRDSVSLKISLNVNSSIPQDAFLSLSASDKVFTDNSSGFPSSISSWFLLESDVRGPVEEPSYYFDQSNPNRLKDLELLLLTQGWRDFKWKYETAKYLPEYGFTVSGRVRKKIVDVPLKNSSVTIGILRAGKPLIYSLPLDSAGKFYIESINFTGDAKLIASVTGDKDNLKGWLLLDSLKYSPEAVQEIRVPINLLQNNELFTGADNLIAEDQIIRKNLHSFIQYAEIKNSTLKQYKLSDTIKPGEVTIIAKRKDWTETASERSRHYLMGSPDYSDVITPEDRIYNTAYGKIKYRYVMPANQRSIGMGVHYILNPLYMIDGVKVLEDEVKALPISLVERIDVVHNSASMLALQTMVESEGIDSLGFSTYSYGYPDGAISIILKDPNDPIFNKNVLHSVNTKISGYYEPRIFYSPKHHTTLESDYKPDLRTTLYWEPNIKVENNKDIFLNYFNADNRSTIEIVAEGITTNGIPVTGKVEYEVK